MRLFKKTSIDFMGKRRFWYLISGLIIAIGMVGIAVRGFSFGIDFLGGTEILIRFQQAPDIGDVRSAVQNAGFTGSEIKTFGTPTDILIRTPEQKKAVEVLPLIRASLEKSFPSNGITILKKYEIGPKIGAELRRNAVYAVISTMIIIMIYIGFRFKFIYGVAGVVALIHDVLATLGIIVIVNGLSPHLNLEIDQNIMAAFLTLVGFSINDTVVVFDRIRENLKIHKADNLFTIINRSINETLSRTIITSGTVILVLIVLIIFGGEVNRGFAVTFFLGTIFGTYSSIYVASSIVLDYSYRKGKK